ncbi:MAG: hypothetical protein K2Z81_02795, partial [Cyanobacteria bacterium]|nr:hypothetical protein [Cyanobacteriota bacterium]
QSRRRLAAEYKERLKKDLPEFQRREVELSKQVRDSAKADSSGLEEKVDNLERDLQADLIGWSKVRIVGPLNVKIYRIRAKIDDGAHDGRLSSSEIANANRELIRLRELQDRWTADNLRVRDWEWKALSMLADQLEAIVDYQLANSIVADRTNVADAGEKRKNAPCLWYPSRHGGYYDASGNVNGSILANELYRYGGLMADGSPAPSNQNVKADSHGHLM